MAVTENSFTGNGSTTNYSFTFPYLKSTDVEVQVDATVQATSTWSFANATTVQFNTAPANGAKIKILRQTNVDNLTATFYAGSAIKSEDLNDNYTQNLYKTQEVGNRYFSNTGGTMTGDLTMAEDTSLVFEGATDDAYETTLAVADPTADRTITLPNVTGTVVTTGDTNTVTGTMIANDTVTATQIATNAVTAFELADNAVDTAAIAADAVNGTKIADDSINSEHYVDGSIDTAHIADLQVTTAKIAADAITGAKVADDSIDSEHLVADSIDTEHYAAGSVDATALATNAVTTAKIADDAVTNAKMADDAINSAQIADNAVGLAQMQDNSVGSSELVDSSVTAAKLASNAVTNAKMADNAVGTAEIADNAVTTAKIADAELTTLAGMQSGTASTLADSTALAATTTEINAICDGKSVQTTISDTDASYPTSGAVVDYVTAQIAPLGGLEVIANEDSFPTTQPAAGVVISIADAGGVVFNGSGVSTTARTAGNGSDNVTINGAPSSLYSETLVAGVGMMVSSTGSGNIYTYHKILGKEDDIKQLSDDINDFNARYRVASSAPSSSNDSGDLYWDTSSNELKVYNAGTSAWEDVASSGNFYINTISQYSGTGGNSASFNGSAYRFTISNPPTDAAQLLVSINGVLQKPNAGTSQPSEGFAINGATIVLSSAPATSSDYFIVTIGSAVSIGTPSNNTVTTAILQNLAVTTAKIAADAIDGTKIADDAINSEHYTDGSIDTAHIADVNVTQAKIADQAINEAKLQVSNAPTNGYVLTAQSGNTGGMTWEVAAAGATGGNNNLNGVFWENQQTITHDYTIQNNYNAGSFGPVTINSGVTVTVGAGETWTII